MASNNKLTADERKAANEQAHQAKEKIFKLVVKIISWETKSMDSLALRTDDRISSQEWNSYKQHIMEISKSESLEKVKSRLVETYKSIQSNNGFK